MRAEEWDARYRAAEMVWGAAPNRWVEAEVADLAPGRALDLACGEGRNAVWLARRGWQVVAVDFSSVGLAKGRELESHELRGPAVDWVQADVTTYRPEGPFDLALLCYLHLVADERRAAVRHAAEALGPGGVLLVIGHDSRNIADGTGGPQDPAVLFTAAAVADDLSGTGLTVEKATEALRPVEGAGRPAIDALVRAVRGT
jgi:SAM-dependent methyltransferase